MSKNKFEEWLQKRIQQNLPGVAAQNKMMPANRKRILPPENARQSGVLVLLYAENLSYNIILIERTADGSVHSGQIALPGGSKELSDADLVDTALREAYEEVGLEKESIDVFGPLSNLYIPVSNFLVQPILAFAKQKPTLEPDTAEVARILYLPLTAVFSRKEQVAVCTTGNSASLMHVNAYIIESHTILWGATAMMLAELEALWNEFNAL